MLVRACSEPWQFDIGHWSARNQLEIRKKFVASHTQPDGPKKKDRQQSAVTMTTELC